VDDAEDIDEPLAALPDEVELDRELAARGLRPYLQVAWSQVEKQPFVPNWHIDAICDHLQAVSAGELRNLIINVPPGCTKSLSTGVIWPTWEWATIDAGLRYIFSTYSASLARRDGTRMRNLIESDWYRARWPHVRIPRQNTRSATEIVNEAGGARWSTSVRGGVLGKHAHRIGIDDPITPMHTTGSRAALGTELDFVEEWFNTTMPTRQADPKRTAWIIVMQRLHERDLAGIAEASGDYTVLRLPMRYERKFHCVTPWAEDPREEEGELLDPARFPEPEVRRLEKKLGPLGAAAQLQQRPAPAGGLIFKQSLFQYWGAPNCKHRALPERVRLIQIWDCSFKGAGKGKKRSFVCGQVWAQAGADMFLVDQERGQWELLDTCGAVRRLISRWPRAFRKYVEDAANGPAVVNVFSKKIGGFKLVATGGGSEARAQAASVFFGDAETPGNVYLPHPSIAPWVKAVEDELIAFPMAAHDDTVDCLTHAVVIMAEGSAALLKQAMDNISGSGTVRGGGLVA